MNRKGLAFILCAPSGTGKTSLIKRLSAEFTNITFSVSATTRLPRKGEEHGKDYYFLSKEDFLEKKEDGLFAEWAEVHGNYYGTFLNKCIDTLNTGRDVLFDIDVQGAAQLYLTMPCAYFVFCFPPSLEELRSRLVKRGTDDMETIMRRLRAAKGEMLQAHWFNAWIINDNLDTAYDKLRSCYLSAINNPKLYPSLSMDILNT